MNECFVLLRFRESVEVGKSQLLGSGCALGDRSKNAWVSHILLYCRSFASGACSIHAPNSQQATDAFLSHGDSDIPAIPPCTLLSPMLTSIQWSPVA